MIQVAQSSSGSGTLTCPKSDMVPRFHDVSRTIVSFVEVEKVHFKLRLNLRFPASERLSLLCFGY